MRVHRHVLICILLGLVSTSGCTLLQSRSFMELMMMAEEEGERVLREPMTVSRGDTLVLVFALDGVGHDEFMRAVRSGGMERTAELFGAETSETDTFEHAYSAREVLSVLPSSTTAAWAAIFTGRPAAETGVPGNEWFDRAEMQFHAPTPVSTDRRYHVLGNYTDDRIGPQIRVPTLYERAAVRAHVSLLPIYRGADLLNIPRVEPFGKLFNAALRQVVRVDSADYRFYEKLDKLSVQPIGDSLDRHGMPDLQVVYLPGLDMFTHIAPSPLSDQQRYLSAVIDPTIGEVLDRYRSEGVMDRTYVLFVSDHGHTPIDPSRNALSRTGAKDPAALLEKVGFRVRPRALKTKAGDFQAVLSMQGGLAYVYLADRSSCPEAGLVCDWSRSPRQEEDVLAVARAYHEANLTGAHVPELQGTLDLIFARTGAVADVDAPPFQVFDGEQLVPIGEYLERHPRPDLLGLEERLEDLAAGPYGYLAGDLLLLPRVRLDEPVEHRTYFGQPGFYTTHGSPNLQDSQVVFILAHQQDSGRELRHRAEKSFGRHPSQMDLTPLVLDLLNAWTPPRKDCLERRLHRPSSADISGEHGSSEPSAASFPTPTSSSEAHPIPCSPSSTTGDSPTL